MIEFKNIEKEYVDEYVRLCLLINKLHMKIDSRKLISLIYFNLGLNYKSKDSSFSQSLDSRAAYCYIMHKCSKDDFCKIQSKIGAPKLTLRGYIDHFNRRFTEDKEFSSNVIQILRSYE